MTINSTWLKVNKRYANICKGGTNQYIERIHVQGANGAIRIPFKKLMEMAQREYYALPGDLIIEYEGDDPLPYVPEPQDFTVPDKSGPNAKGEWLSTANFEVDYQDTSWTCQASMIQTITNGAIEEAEARRLLELYGNPGNPHIIGRVIREAVGDRYEYWPKGSINDMISVIKQGALIGLQASVTEAGHVFTGNGYDQMADELKRNYPNHPELHEGIKVIDPWTYYDWLKLRYTGKTLGYVGWYPIFGIWASAVKAFSFYEFGEYYHTNPTHDWKADKGAYLHIVWPEVRKKINPSSPSVDDGGLVEARQKAFLDVIAWCEGTTKDPDNGYRTMFTHQLFDSFDDHPRILHGSGNLHSDAAGRYQFLSTTWDEAAKALSLPSFSPANQDKAAIWLIDVKRNALDEVNEGDIEGACQRLSLEWASLPFSPYGQPTHTLKEVKAKFNEFLEMYWPRF